MKQDSEPSLGEFMKISLEGFSWAENICQRVENICTENNMVQNPGKYVNAVGEHFKKVIHTVVNDLCDQADDVLELFSEITSGHASLVKSSGKMGEELIGDLLHEKPSSCIFGEETPLMETLSLEHDHAPKVLGNLSAGSEKSTSDGTVFAASELDEAFSSTVDSLSKHGDSTMVHERARVEIDESIFLEKYACDRFERARSTEDLSQAQVRLQSEPQFSNKMEVSTGMLVETPMFGAEGLNYSAENFSNAAALDVNFTRSLSLAEANSPMTHKSTVTGELSPCYSICFLDLESLEASCHSESNGSKLTWRKGRNEGEFLTKNAADFQENLNIISREEFGNSSIFNLKNEDLNDFEDVKLEDDFEAVKVENDWDEMVMAEIALISSQVAKKESSKKKLKKMLTSRWRASRGRQLVTHQADQHSKTSLDSDWELL
ncbi:uncharacterized protein LOC110093562 isoform X2 [Dendrobium catenatum]|uniref:uncharacterized protein LOC110093562 isoform X2 n=1 Tax=Dendrobium catenatum TaxID=906689 RepID=UPI0009F1C644|nr:uncharacterized protein LOC110093562 isoform X2 [Dendrobium catenatum]